MNILYLTNHLNIGGITSYVLSLSKAFKQRGHKVYIASSGGQALSAFIEEGVAYIPIPIKTKSEVSPRVLISLLKLSTCTKELDIDIIHANTRVTQVLGFFMHMRFLKPYISTCHGFFKKRFSRRMFPCWGDKVIAISEAVKEHLRQDFKVREGDIRVIHNGIDIERFKPLDTENKAQIKKSLGLGNGPLVGIVARLSDVKGHAYLIKSMQSVLEMASSAQLLIVGEGRMKRQLLELSRQLEIEKSIFFMPSVRDTAEILPIFDVFVLPSLEEGLGLSLMEAMATGLAVVGSNVGGIRSLIQDGFNGLLAEPADIRSLSGAILELLQDPAKRRAMGDSARLFIKQNFSLEGMVAQTEQVYRECLSARY